MNWPGLSIPQPEGTPPRHRMARSEQRRSCGSSRLRRPSRSRLHSRCRTPPALRVVDVTGEYQLVSRDIIAASVRHIDALRVERHHELGVDKSLSDIDDPAQRYSFPDDFLSQYVDDQYALVLVDVPGSTSNVAADALWATKHVFTPVRRVCSIRSRRRRSAQKLT